MVCINCGHKTQVSNSRLQKRTNQVWRRRSCHSCGAVFTTNEMPDYGASWLVQSKSGTLTPFSRDKLFLSLLESSKHRPTALTDAAGLCDTIMAKLAPQIIDGHVPAKTIVETTQVSLNRFDKVSSALYAALHKL